MSKSKVIKIDALDKKILNLLLNNARCSFTDIAKQLKVSGGTIHFRMKKLEKTGLVNGALLQIDTSKLGYDIIAFLGLHLKKGQLSKEGRKKFQDIPEITQLYYTAGAYTLMAKIVCKDTTDLAKLITDKIQSIEEVERTETFITLEEIANRQISIG